MSHDARGASGSRRPSRPELGARVAFVAELVRDKQYDAEVRWISKPCDGEGIYAGYRVVFEGDHVAGNSEEPGYLGVSKGVSHAIVITSERANPKRVPWDALKLREQLIDGTSGTPDPPQPSPARTQGREGDGGRG